MTGAELYDLQTEQTVFCRTMPNAVLASVIEAVERFPGAYCQLYCEREIVANEYAMNWIRENRTAKNYLDTVRDRLITAAVSYTHLFYGNGGYMIISASRRTDLPAFYANWLKKRFEEGYALVRNPMNYHQVSKVLLDPEHVDGIVFWTKNPAPLLPYFCLLYTSSEGIYP